MPTDIGAKKNPYVTDVEIAHLIKLMDAKDTVRPSFSIAVIREARLEV